MRVELLELLASRLHTHQHTHVSRCLLACVRGNVWWLGTRLTTLCVLRLRGASCKRDMMQATDTCIRRHSSLSRPLYQYCHIKHTHASFNTPVCVIFQHIYAYATRVVSRVVFCFCTRKLSLATGMLRVLHPIMLLRAKTVIQRHIHLPPHPACLGT